MKFKILAFSVITLSAIQLSAQTLPNANGINNTGQQKGQGCQPNLLGVLNQAASYLKSASNVSNSMGLKVGRLLGVSAAKVAENDWQALRNFVNTGMVMSTSFAVTTFTGQLQKAGYVTNMNTKCVRYTDANGMLQFGTPQQFLQAVINSL